METTPVLAAARILLAKGIPFCLYRLPLKQDQFQLAVETANLPHKPFRNFWMAPFVKNQEAPDIFLQVVREEAVSASWIASLEHLESETIPDLRLPVSTQKEDYFAGVKAILKDIHNGKLRKAVFSRVIHQPKPAGFDALKCFQKLARDYPNTFAYLAVHPSSGVWMGASPELLLRIESNQFHIMALAGTQARRAEGDYSWREKEKEEHFMVGQHVEAVSRQFDLKLLRKDGPNTVEAGQVVHLRTDYFFEPLQRLDLKQFLTSLHPTPAVGGLPVEEGVRCVLKHERYNRRYYCGFIGETDFEGKADLYINLRNMQIGKEDIAVFVGGGITALSDPGEEWEETVMKSKTMVEKIVEQN